jgi:hypothetical protein
MMNNNRKWRFIIFKFLHEQKIQKLIFTYSQFKLLIIICEAQEIKQLEIDLFQIKFIPTIHTQYFSRILIPFSNAV